MNGQDARSTRKSTLCGTGILPVKREWCVPQENLLFVEQASCLLSENGARCELKPTQYSLFTLFNVPLAIAIAILNTQYFKITCGRSLFNSVR